MKLISKHKGKEVWLDNYTRDNGFKVNFENKPFVCLLWNNRADFVSSALIEQILKANCKYLLAGGENCEKWHDYADEIHISLYPDFDIPDSEHVMTTWHSNESLEEVVLFTLNSTNFDDHDFDRFLIIQIDERFSENKIQEIVGKHLL